MSTVVTKFALLLALALLVALHVRVARLTRWTDYNQRWAACGMHRAPCRVCGATSTLADLMALEAQR